MRGLLVSTAVALALSLSVACDESSAPDAASDSAGETSSGPDTAADAGNDGDAGSSADATLDVAGADVGTVGEFVVGVNVTAKNTPEFFTELPDGGDINIEYGPQGLWMVVMAFKTHGIWDTKAELTMTWSCWLDGNNLGESAQAKQRLVGGGDGWWYYYNFYLVIDPFGAAGNDAEIRLSITDGAGNKVERTHAVHLVGGP